MQGRRRERLIPARRGLESTSVDLGQHGRLSQLHNSPSAFHVAAFLVASKPGCFVSLLGLGCVDTHPFFCLRVTFPRGEPSPLHASSHHRLKSAQFEAVRLPPVPALQYNVDLYQFEVPTSAYPSRRVAKVSA